MPDGKAIQGRIALRRSRYCAPLPPAEVLGQRVEEIPGGGARSRWPRPVRRAASDYSLGAFAVWPLPAPATSAYTSRTALLTKRSAVRSTNTWLPSVHDGAVKCGLGVRTFPRPDASPPRCAQLMGLASRGCLVLVLGATTERRNLLFRSDLGLPWIRALSVRLSW